MFSKKEKWSGGQCPTDEEVGPNADQMFFYVPLVNIPFVWRRYHYQGRSAQIKDFLDANGLRIWRDINRVVLAMSWRVDTCNFIRLAAVVYMYRYSSCCCSSSRSICYVYMYAVFFLSERLFIRILYYNN